MAAMATATLQNFMMSITDGNRVDDIDYFSNRNVDKVVRLLDWSLNRLMSTLQHANALGLSSKTPSANLDTGSSMPLSREVFKAALILQRRMRTRRPFSRSARRRACAALIVFLPLNHVLPTM